VQYKFMSGTIVMRDFSSINTFTWTPAFMKNYTSILVVARDVNTGLTVTSPILNINVTPVLSAVNLVTAPSGTAPLGSPVTLYSTITGGASVQYKFMAGETILRDFSAVNNFTWISTAVGTIPLTVVVRDINCSTPDATLTSAVTNFVVAGDKSVNTVDLAKMVWVAPGTFTMGNITGSSTEKPAHQVTLSGYWMYKNVVTVAQYRAFCTATSRALPAFPTGYSWAGKSGWADAALQQHPIVNVSWLDAKAYADWAGVALPTEAQWEYAARGSDGRNYPWGGVATATDPYNGYDAAKCANSSNSSSIGKSTWPVCSFPTGASWTGALDMTGNVWQWCADWHDVYQEAPATDPTGPATGTYRIIRGGGSWANKSENYGRCAFRTKNTPTILDSTIGFRCVSNTTGP
jgi:formylglycine-generating enzyme required for sulfatase activity